MKKKRSVIYASERAKEAEKNVRMWNVLRILILIIFAAIKTILFNSQQLDGVYVTLISFDLFLTFLMMLIIESAVEGDELEETGNWELANSKKKTSFERARYLKTNFIHFLPYEIYCIYLLILVSVWSSRC